MSTENKTIQDYAFVAPFCPSYTSPWHFFSASIVCCNEHPGSHNRHTSPLPTTARAFISIAGRESRVFSLFDLPRRHVSALWRKHEVVYMSMSPDRDLSIFGPIGNRLRSGINRYIWRGFCHLVCIMKNSHATLPTVKVTQFRYLL